MAVELPRTANTAAGSTPAQSRSLVASPSPSMSNPVVAEKGRALANWSIGDKLETIRQMKHPAKNESMPFVEARPAELFRLELVFRSRRYAVAGIRSHRLATP